MRSLKCNLGKMFSVMLLVVCACIVTLGGLVFDGAPTAFAQGETDVPPVSAEDIVEQGSCGTNVNWSLDKYGVLRITGEGDVSFSGNTAPWNESHKEDIRFVIVGEDITHFPMFSFTSSNTIAMFFTGPYIPGYQMYFENNAIMNFSGLGYYRKGDTSWESVGRIGTQAPKEYLPGMTTVDWSTVEDIGLSGEESFWTYGNSEIKVYGSGVVDTHGWHEYRDNITRVSVAEGITALDVDLAFAWCSELTTVSLPSSLTRFGSGMFQGCTKLASIELPDKVTTLPESTFSSCTSLTSVSLGDSLTTIGADAFRGCANLSSISLPSGVTSIGESAFWYCGSLSSVEFPKGLTSIAGAAFMNCAALKRIDFLGDVPTIGSDAFQGVTASAVHHENTDAWKSFNKSNDFGGDLTWYSLGSGGSLVEDPYVCPSHYRLFELSPDTWDTQSNYPTEYVAWHISISKDQSVELAFSYNYDESCIHHNGALRLISAAGNDGEEVWTAVFTPTLAENRKIYYESLTLPAGDYYLLGSLFNSHDNSYSSFSVKYELPSATEIPDPDPDPEPQPQPAQTITMHRLYNRWTGEHFYTSSDEEKAHLVGVGWTDEGKGWVAPAKSSTPVYRLYNPYVSGGDHHYTTSAAERDACVAAGWRDEGVGWYSDDAKGTPLYRQYNPYASTGTHNYTVSKGENDHLVSVGWREEGIAWYGVK